MVFCPFLIPDRYVFSQFYNIYIIKKRNSSQPAEGGECEVQAGGRPWGAAGP